jgi:hypothetical protein
MTFALPPGEGESGGAGPAASSPAASASDALAALQVAPLPPPVPYTPQTWGWAVVGLLVVVFAAWLVGRAVRRHRAQRYRREALRELERLEAALHDEAGRSAALAALPALAKRVALAAAPRSQVAGLSGEPWLRWLDASGGEGRFTRGPGRLLATLAYAPGAPADADVSALVALLRTWIRRHHA